MRHSFSVCSGVCLVVSALLVGCKGSSVEDEASPKTPPLADEPPLVAPRAPDLRLGGLEFRHCISGPALAFSPDGKTLFSGGTDGTVREWEVSTGELRRTLTDRGGEVRALALAPNGQVLACGSKDGSVTLWDLTTAKELWRKQAHEKGITSIAFAEQGKTIVSAGRDSTARVLDAASGREVRCLVKEEIGEVIAAVSPDGESVATSGIDPFVRVMKVSDGTESRRIERVGEVDALCFSPDGQQVVAAGPSARITILDLETGKESPQSPNQKDSIHAVAYSPDGKRFVTGGSNRAVVWDTATGKPIRELEGLCDRSNAAAYSRDGKFLAVGGYDGVVRLFDGPSGRPLLCPEGHQAGVSALAVTSDGKALASGAGDGTVRIWEIPSGKPIRKLSWDPGKEFWQLTRNVFSISICSNGRQLASSTGHGPVRVWDLGNGKQVATIGRDHQPGVGAVVFTKECDELLIGGLDTTLGFWDCKTGKPLRMFEQTGGVRCLALSPDGRTFACPGIAIPQTVVLRSSQTGAFLAKLAVPADEPEKHRTLDQVFFCFSPDGRTLAVAGENMDGEAGHPICLFDVATGNVVRAFGHRVRITALAYSPDGMTVAAACGDGAIGIWDTATGDRREYFRSGQWRVWSLVFSPDGHWLFSGGEDGTICGWRLGNRS